MASSDELLRIIAEAQESGAKVVMVEVPAVESAPAEPEEDPRALALKARERLKAVAAEAANFPAEGMATVRGHDPEGNLSWPVLAVVFLALGALIERFFHRWGRSHFMYLFNPTPQSRAEKSSYLLVRGLMKSAGLAIQVAVALLFVFAIADVKNSS